MLKFQIFLIVKKKGYHHIKKKVKKVNILFFILEFMDSF